MIIKARLAPLGAISGPEGALARRKSAFYVAPNGADRVFYLRIYKDLAPTEPGTPYLDFSEVTFCWLIV